MSLKIKRGTNSQRLTVVPAEGELVYATDIKKLFIGDGTTTGGNIVGLALEGTIENNMYLGNHHLYGSNGLDLDGNSGNVTANNVFADFHGSMYGSDSSLLIDYMNSVILGPIHVSINDIVITGGSSNDVISTDGNGNLSWVTLSGGGGISLPSQSGHDGEYLTTDGAGNLSWSAISGGGSLPSQTGEEGKFLTNDGLGTLSWTNALGYNLNLNGFDIIGDDTSSILTDISIGSTINNNTLTIHNSVIGLVLSGLTTGSSPSCTTLQSKTSRNTLNSPQIVQAGDSVFKIISESWDGTQYIGGGGIIFNVDSAALNDIPLSVSLFSYGNSIAKKATLDSNGDFTIENGMKCKPLAAAPGTPVAATMYVADGTNWDPASKSGSVPYPVFYDGSAYHALY